MTEVSELLAAYDDQLRGHAELRDGWTTVDHGPLVWGVSASGRGFVTYRSLHGHADRLGDLVTATVAYFRDETDVHGFEWKTRGHDHAPGLHDLLVDAGLEPEDVESIMVGRAEDLAVDVDLPADVTVRRATTADDVRRVSALAAEVFGRTSTSEVDLLVERVRGGADGLEIWLAEAAGEVVSSGRMEPVEGTDFAGLWGGCTLAAWRGRGVYRALTAERARSALREGFTLMSSDSTEFSRPILERSGFVTVTTSTPYQWTRG